MADDTWSPGPGGLDDDIAPGARGIYDPKKGTYRRFGETTLLDPSAITTERSRRTNFSETHPYGEDSVRVGVAPATSRSWQTTQRHHLDREDV